MENILPSQNTTMDNQLTPTSQQQRYIVLDALRGFALLGICMANFPELSLWSFLNEEQQMAMPTSYMDLTTKYLLLMFVDAKFYSIFGILFGIGFAIILNRAEERGSSGIRLFYKRMVILLCFGLAHLLLLWSGDILSLYAVIGMLLPLLRKQSTERLLWMAAACLFLPILLDLYQELSGVSFSAPIVKLWWEKAYSYGITEENFASWLRDAKGYEQVHQFLMQGAIERMYEFVEGHRVLKVLGLFLIGYCIGRDRMYARLGELHRQMKRLLYTCLVTALPTMMLYATSAMTGHGFGETAHSLLYTLSALPMAMVYIIGFSLLANRNPNAKLLRILAKPGQMALTNYIMQSVFGIFIYYGIGCKLGLSMGLMLVEVTALYIFAFQTGLSYVWLKHFRYGPLEWVWRMCTYGKWLPIKR